MNKNSLNKKTLLVRIKKSGCSSCYLLKLVKRRHFCKDSFPELLAQNLTNGVNVNRKIVLSYQKDNELKKRQRKGRVNVLWSAGWLVVGRKGNGLGINFLS